VKLISFKIWNSCRNCTRFKQIVAQFKLKPTFLRARCTYTNNFSQISDVVFILTGTHSLSLLPTCYRRVMVRVKYGKEWLPPFHSAVLNCHQKRPVESAVLYRVIQEETSMFWEVIVLVSVRKNGSYEHVSNSKWLPR